MTDSKCTLIVLACLLPGGNTNNDKHRGSSHHLNYQFGGSSLGALQTGQICLFSGLAIINVFQPHNVVFTEVIASLHLD